MTTNKTKANVIAKVKCSWCGELHDEDIITETEDGPVCPVCLDYNYRVCAECGKYHDEDDMTFVYEIDDYVCNNCIDANYYYCDNCGEYHSEPTERVETPHGVEDWCYDCIQEYGYYCDECGTLYHIDCMQYDDRSDCYYCYDCFENARHNGLIGDYHCGNPNGLKFKGALEWSRLKGYIGFELEYFCDYPEDLARAVHDVDDFNTFHFEDDTSVSIELVSQPMTYEYIRTEHEHFESIFNAIQESGGTCTDGTGLHVHISRSAFGKTETERAERIAKLLMLFSGKSYDVMGKLAGRCSHWADTVSGNRAYIKERATKRGGGHSVAVNLEHSETVEFRLAKSVNNYSDLLNWLEVLLHIVERSKTIDETIATNYNAWFAKCNNIVYAQLVKHGINIEPVIDKMTVAHYENIITKLCMKIQDLQSRRNMTLSGLGLSRDELPPIPTLQQALANVTKLSDNIKMDI